MEKSVELGGNPGSKRQKTFHQNSLPALPYEHYTIAWISALHIEMAAARAMLDEVHESPPRKADDTNTYALGKIHDHNVVIACLPVHEYGTNNAAAVVTNMRRTFPGIEIGLMVGIGGGAPGKEDIRLGDIVVGTRVMQYDLGKIMSDGKFHRSAFPRTHGHLLGTAVSSLRSRHELEPSRVPLILQEKLARQNPEYRCPVAPDRLFDAAYEHENSLHTCEMCDPSKLKARSKRVPGGVKIHYGAIASGNQVMKHACTRDNIARELDVLCFEMEAAGIMDILPCLPIRGVCDYSDSHKNKEWQRYAAGTAAAYARELIGELPGAEDLVLNNFNSDADQPSTQIYRHSLLDSLTFNQLHSRRLNIKRHHTKTCQWFINHPDYMAWLDPLSLKRTYGFLWINGKPGSGKSTIMKFAHSKMISDLRAEGSLGKGSFIASFFFNARGEYLEKSIFGMYRSLLYQLLKGYPDLQKVLDELEHIHRDQDECPSLNILKDLFHAAVSSLDRRHFICYIDALDEGDEQQVREMVDYFEDLAEECTEQGISFRICFSSRHYPYIVIRHGVRLTLEDEAGHAKDLETYIASRLLVKEETLIQEIWPQLLTKAAGVFMWVVLVVDILNKEYQHGGLSLRRRLAEIPSDLSELFKDILQRDKSNTEALLLCIRWLLFAERPLNPQEFYHALWCGLAANNLADHQIPEVVSSESSERISIFVISSSKGLAEITGSNTPNLMGSSTPVVQFIHESVRDFLIKDRALFELWPELEARWDSLGHDALSKCCYGYLNRSPTCISSDDFASFQVKEYPFLRYATGYVLHHANLAASEVPQNKLLRQFPTEKWRNLSILAQSLEIHDYSPSITLLYILADKGLYNLVRTRIQDGPQVSYGGERYGYPLFVAMAKGHRDIIAALLNIPSPIEDEADVDESHHLKQSLKGYENRTPLSWAAQEGRLDIIGHLLKLNVDVNERDGREQTALSRATQNRQWAAFRLLVENGAYVNSCTEHGWTPLHYASQGGQTEMVGLLIRNGADINARSKDGWTPLLMASQGGHLTIARILVDNGADVNARDEDGWAPLIRASRGGHEAISKLLVDSGASLDAIDGRYGYTSLCWAAQNGHEAIMRLLVGKGANLNLGGKDGCTPLKLVSQNGHEKARRFLIETIERS